MSELGLVTPAGKVVWGNFIFLMMVLLYGLFFMLLLNLFAVNGVAGKYAQVTNNPENDGCVNAVLLV